MTIAIESLQEEDTPSPGTPCVVCRAMGHWCPAYRYVGSTEDGICRPCMESKNCPRNLAVIEMESEEVDFTERLRKQILEAPLTESNTSIGLRTGTSPQYVDRIRKKAGIEPIKEKCVIEGCENLAPHGYSFCSISHNRQLEIEKYEQIVAARKAGNHHKVHKKLQRPAGIKRAKRETAMENGEVVEIKDTIELKRTTEGFTYSGDSYPTQDEIEEVAKTDRPWSLGKKENKKVKEMPVVVVHPKVKARTASEITYDAVIRDLEAQLAELQDAQAKIAKLKTALAVLKELRGA